MKRILFIEKKQRNLVLGLFGLIFIIVAVLSWTITQKGQEVIDTEVQNYLTETSQQTSYKVNQRVNHNIDQLTILAQHLNHVDKNQYQNLIFDTVDNSAFEWIGFINKDGVLDVDGLGKKDMSKVDVIKNALRGEGGVSNKLVKVYSDVGGALYAIPFRGHDADIVAVAGWIPPSTMKLLLNTDTFSGSGFSHIISKDGDFILHSNNTNALIGGDNFFKTFKKVSVMEKGYSLDKMIQDIKDGKSGIVEFNVKNKESRSLTYTPLAKGDWYLLSIVPTDAHSQNITGYMYYALLSLTICVVLLFLVVVFIILRITAKKNQEITDIAYKDSITGGYTQIRFDLECRKILKDFKPFTFVSLDLRKFKLINDSFGSQLGNKVLKHIHECILENIKDDEFVARINADNFNIILQTTDPDIIEERLNKISDDINGFDIQKNVPYFLPITCGSYIVTDSSLDLVSIRDKANIARKNAKDINSYYLCSNAYYNDIEHQKMMKEKDMENMMEKALEEEQFIVYLQPKVSLKTGKVIGSEALVRWDNPINGLIPPNDFIPFFEKNNFIVKLDMYVFEKVCQILRKWIDEGKDVLPISVNLSRNHLQNSDFLKDYKNIQSKYQIPSELIEIELTETVVFENLEILRHIINEIHNCGYKCSMDDFGSGYSSLNVLKEIPVDILKLDKVFFGKENNQRANDIVESVIRLAKKLGMETIAEGIETIPQVELLRSMECDMIQGYVFSKPVPVDEFEKIIQLDVPMMKIE
ncbi:MAG: EAL domain-containing protein [Longibaculum muris]|uniref:Diguanylate cyclase (GGDEF)-like protein n=1 Tax=Longibaculum muris TaxID=1796628 RepID=A0A4R3YIT7_9FIRM|nr:EAL domain-containing protein [Longibaculum muris]KXU42309.1 diguanylate cyclase domain protein [Candidatus Stoquefichus sp. KLE1796]MBS5370113.1 EAL domain-containing protein [Coprobacillus cateniformis]MCR1889337.1 EAL domain-containing protein [Longibaculum muris]MED9812399.1 EAL domain-containing protein [Longibaculum muris]TCV91248.1 diguanylate cyclase (GGDEF)-like protein [Longibaculum muris]